MVENDPLETFKTSHLNSPFFLHKLEISMWKWVLAMRKEFRCVQIHISWRIPNYFVLYPGRDFEGEKFLEQQLFWQVIPVSLNGSQGITWMSLK